MNSKTKITLLMLFFMIAGNAQSINSSIKKHLDLLEEKDFSGTILIAQNDSILEERAYGYSSIEYNILNNIDTKFNIASITKLFTAVATLQLYEQGELELDKPIGSYLPDYPNKLVRDSVTVHQLLTHTSGLNNFYVSSLDNINPLTYNKISDFLPLFENDPLLSKPGATYNYSASGYVLLGLIIEKISGVSYYDYIRKNILNRAQMPNTSEIEVDAIRENKASGYTTMFGENEILKKNDYYLTKASPAGFYYSTVKDLFSFSKALRNFKLLKKVTTEMMLAPKVKGYNTFLGYGIDVDTRYNKTIIGITGGWYGIHCEMLDFMDDHYTVIILSNIDDGGDKGASIVADYFKNVLSDKPLAD